MKLNTDYEEIKRQAKEIENHIINCKTANMALSYFSTYEMLCMAYLNLTGENIFSKRIYKNTTISKRSLNQEKKFNKELIENCRSNKKNHIKMIVPNLQEPVDALEEVFDSSEWEKLQGRYFKTIDNKKAEDILYDYFKHTDIELIDIYKDLKEKEKIFLLHDSYSNENEDTRGITYGNSLQNSCIILVNDEKNNVSSLSTIVHELGHVKDYLDIRKRFSLNDQYTYPYKSLFTEVISTNYELKFYEYLIENNLLSEEAKLSLTNFYSTYFESLDNAFIYSNVDDRYDKMLNNRFFTKQEVTEISGLGDIYDGEFTDIMPPFYENLEYGYGLLISTHIKNNKDILENFLNMRNGYFDYDELNNIGITPKETSKKLVKNITNYLK